MSKLRLPAHEPLPIKVYRKAAPDLSGASYPLIALFRDSWDDYGYQTLFIAHVYLSDQEKVRLGPVKIAVGGEGFRPEVGATLSALPPTSYSLGQDVGYYRTLGGLSPRLRRRVLRTLNDCISIPKNAADYRNSEVFEKSLLRSGSARHALRRGGFYIGAKTEDVRPPRFLLRMKLSDASSDHMLGIDFSSSPELPHRTTLLIGRNGTGKTTALATLAYRLAPGPGVFQKDSLNGVALDSDIRSLESDDSSPLEEISQVIAVTYNAFDDFPLPEKQNASLGTYRSRLNYKYCGLRNMDGQIDTNQIVTMWGKALEPIRAKDRVDVFAKAVARFLDDDIVAALNDGEDAQRRACLRRLSAGQRILVSIFADIVATVEEGSILLIDEPETHLHPGLLIGAFFAVQDLLREFDSYAIISTHSPILLQNVPSDFVRVLKRSGTTPRVETPNTETFGEDLGEIFRQDLGLAEPERDFTHVLQELHETLGSSSQVEALFKGELGLPAKAFLLSLDRA